MSDPAPFVSSLKSIQPEWIDYNGHLNMAYYGVLFDTGADEIYEELGFGPHYRDTRGFTTYIAEFHICYLRELALADKVRVTWHVLDYDAKRIHAYQEIHHEDGWLAATAEGLTLHVDISGPKVAPMPADILANVARVVEVHAALPRPKRAGRQIGIARKG